MGLLLAGLFVLAPPLRAATPSPNDWRDQSIYQILTDRFFDGDPSNNALEGYYDPSDGARIHGGDWAGIEEKLDYIRGLGATSIWISPVQKNAFAAYHGYHIQDFHQFAPHFGGEGDLVSLIDEAHAHGLYMILDVIANHGGDLIDSADPDYPDFHDPGDYVLRWKNTSNKAAPPFDDLSWYHNNGHINDWVDPEQILGELFGLDDFRTEEPAVRDALAEAHQWLIERTDADGFRIDTVKHVELSFWQEFAPAVHSFAADSLGKDRFFLYGEIFDGSNWKNGIYTGTMAGGPYALDSVLRFPMHFTTNPVFRDGGATEWLSGQYADSVYYDPAARNRLVLFLDNHDVARFMGFGSSAAEDEAKAKVALAWLYTSVGVPCLYYGTEQEFDGGGDPWNREDMWDGSWDFGPSEGDNFDQTAPLYRWVRRLNGLRRQFPALRRGGQTEIANAQEAGIYSYYRKLTGETTVLVLLNTKGEADTLSVDPDLPGGTVYDLLSERSFTIPSTGIVEIVIGGLSAALLAASPPAPAPWVEAVWPPHDADVSTLRPRIEITFTEPMDHASVEAALDLSPAAAYAASWIGSTLLLLPAADLADHATYTLAIGGSARSLSGDSLGAGFTTFFRTDAGTGPVAVPSGFYAEALPNGDLERPVSLERGPNGRMIVGDRTRDRVFLWNDRGFVETLLVDSLIGRPDALARDRAGGAFGGDLLVSDRSRIFRLALDGSNAGLVRQIAAFPSATSGWAVAVDTTGAFGGLAFAGAPVRDSIYSVDGAGTKTPFAGTFSGVRGLAFASGGSFGRALYATGGDHKVFRIDTTGAASTFADDATLLSGATALAFDDRGAFGGDLFVANPARQEIVRVGPAGAVSIFASGFVSLEGPDCISFDGLGNLYAAEGGTTGDPRIVRIAAVAETTAIPGDGAPPPRFLLGRNAPNPFNGTTRISFTLPRPGRARLAVHDLSGALVRVLLDNDAPEGSGEAVWDGTDANGRRAASGVYLYRLQFDGLEETRRLVLIR
ncbi:MAG: alpha-amylase family glycosyl hydrolase [Candidatus Eisenbacteria bacterium]